MNKELLSIKNLDILLKDNKNDWTIGIQNLDLSINYGETVGIVGESGCGKTLTALSIMGLLAPQSFKIAKGSITFEGKELLGLSEKQYRQIRAKQIAMVFQEPMTALNPVFTIGNQLIEVIKRHRKVKTKEAIELAINKLNDMGINSPKIIMHHYPHQLSGGMIQRVIIAMALLCEPQLLIADEPTTALDLNTQRQVIEKIKILQGQTKMAKLIISHDFALIKFLCSRVYVIYCGRVIETAKTSHLMEKAKHPYTKALLESIPILRDKKIARLPTIEGSLAPVEKWPTACSFSNRCRQSIEICYKKVPPLAGDLDHKFACFNP